MRNKGTPKDLPATLDEARLNLRIPASLRKEIKRAANEQDISMKTWVVRASREKLSRDAREPMPKPYQEEHRNAPKTQSEWEWTYALIRFLRSARFSGLKAHLAELWKMHR